jgi:hypothetical protein
MPKSDAICYEETDRRFASVWSPKKERLRDFITVVSGVPAKRFAVSGLLANSEMEVPQISFATQRRREIPLHNLLEYGAVVIALLCLLSVISWAANVQPLTIINPFAAFLGFVMSPFMYLMGRAART